MASPHAPGVTLKHTIKFQARVLGNDERLGVLKGRTNWEQGSQGISVIELESLDYHYTIV